MRLTTQNLLRITIVISVVLQSCIKQPERGHRFVPPDNVRIFGYKPGTYWVYKDSFSGVYDSFVVKNFRLETASNTYNDDDYVLIDITSYNSINTDDTGLFWMYLNSDSDITFIVASLKYPFRDGYRAGFNDTSSQFKRTSYEYNGSIYHSVLEQFYSAGDNKPGDTAYWHFHRVVDTGVGFLVMDIDNHMPNLSLRKGKTAWRLKRWHIVR